MTIIGTNDTATVRVASLPSGAAFDTAANVTFSPPTGMSATNVQAGISEVYTNRGIFGSIQNFWSDGVTYQIVSKAKGTSYGTSFLQQGTDAAPITSVEPVKRIQAVSEVNVYDFAAADGWKGLTEPVNVIGVTEQYVIQPGAFDKMAGHLIELHDKAPNGGEHYALTVIAQQHANRKDETVNNAETGGLFSINGVGDTWVTWMLGQDKGYKANMICCEMNIHNEWGARPETANLHNTYIPDSGDGFQILLQMSTDFSEQPITRGLSIVPSNSFYTTTQVGFETGIFNSGYHKYGLVFGKSNPYTNPSDVGGSANDPIAIVFANGDEKAMQFWSGGASVFEVTRPSTTQLAFSRNSDDLQFVNMNSSTGAVSFSNGQALFNSSGDLAAQNVSRQKADIAAGFVRINPATGATAAVNGTYSELIIDPAGALSTLTLDFTSASPVHGQVFRFKSTQNITTLTLSGGTFAINNFAVTAGVLYEIIYDSSVPAWY